MRKAGNHCMTVFGSWLPKPLKCRSFPSRRMHTVMGYGGLIQKSSLCAQHEPRRLDSNADDLETGSHLPRYLTITYAYPPSYIYIYIDSFSYKPTKSHPNSEHRPYALSQRSHYFLRRSEQGYDSKINHSCFRKHYSMLFCRRKDVACKR